MIDIEIVNNPTRDTHKMIIGDHIVKIYNYCPGCRGELAPCSIETEMIFYKEDETSCHVSFKKMQGIYWENLNLISQTPLKERSEAGKIDITVVITVRNTGQQILNTLSVSIEEFLNIYKIMTEKHLSAL